MERFFDQHSAISDSYWSTNMQSPYYIDQEANAAVRSTKKAIEHALYEEGVSLSVPNEYTGITGFYADNIRVNKIAYAVIESFDLPAVRTWYRYGQYLPYNELRPKSMTIEAVDSLNEYVYSGWSTDLTVQDLADWLVEELNLPELFDMSLFEFLDLNYNGWEGEFTGIYLASTKVIKILEDMNAMGPGISTQQIATWRDLVQDASLDLEYLIEKMDVFSGPMFRRIDSFFSALEDALIAIEESGGIGKEEYDTISQARSVYHEYVWPFSAIAISLEEIQGPDTDRKYYVESGKDIRDELRGKSETYLRGWEEKLMDADLSPSLNQRQSVIQDAGEISNLVDSGVYFDT